MCEEFKNELKKCLEVKKKEMVSFINQNMTSKEINRIGEEIITIMPNMGDIAMIEIKISNTRDTTIIQETPKIKRYRQEPLDYPI